MILFFCVQMVASVTVVAPRPALNLNTHERGSRKQVPEEKNLAVAVGAHGTAGRDVSTRMHHREPEATRAVSYSEGGTVEARQVSAGELDKMDEVTARAPPPPPGVKQPTGISFAEIRQNAHALLKDTTMQDVAPVGTGIIIVLLAIVVFISIIDAIPDPYPSKPLGVIPHDPSLSFPLSPTKFPLPTTKALSPTPSSESKLKSVAGPDSGAGVKGLGMALR